MEFIQSYTQYIDEEIRKIDIPEKPSDLYDPLRYFLQIGGKRMRPMLTLLGGELFGLKKQDVINAALAIEVFHNFTLIHDDIMDEAPLRRGFTTVHHKWNTNTAILSGDVLMIKAYELLCKQPGDLRQLLELFNKTAIEICEGQQLDVDFETLDTITIPQYIEMIRLKTSVLLGCALEFAAIAANASIEDRKHIYNFGENIGLAFQIQDDILDLYADPKKFGKQVGGDVITNKKTILYLTARDSANESQIAQLNALSQEQDTAKKIAKTRDLFDTLNAKEKCLEMVTNYFNKANEELEKISIPPGGRNVLNHLADYLLTREV